MTVAAMQMAKEQLSALVIAVGDPAALLIEYPVVARGVHAPAPGRDAGCNSLVLNGFAKPVGVVAPVCQQSFGRRKGAQQGQDAQLRAGGLSHRKPTRFRIGVNHAEL